MKKIDGNSRKEIFALVYMVLLLLAGPLVAVILAVDLPTFWEKLIYLLTALSVYGLGLTFLKRRWYFRLAFIFLATSIMDIAHIILYESTTTVMYLFTILRSEKGESSELASFGWVIIVIIATLWLIYLILNRTCVKNEYIASPKVRGILAACMCLWLIISGIGITVHRTTGHVPAFESAIHTCPVNLAYNYGRVTYLKNKIYNAQEKAEDFHFGATSTAEDDEIVVLVLGESTRYRELQINGYERETTPRLMARGSQIISYDSVYTVSNMTALAVPLILSRATPQTLDVYGKEKSIVDAFQESGYQTAWIADQSFRNKFLEKISNRCDYVFYREHKTFDFVDGDLLQPLDDYVNQPVGKQMAVVHSKGCHFSYDRRYPESYHAFHPGWNDRSLGLIRELSDSLDGPANALSYLLTNSYDNAILYMDNFLDSIIITLEQTGRPAVMVYVADHGENLLDDSNHKILHGQTSSSIYEYHSAFFVWASESYKARYPEKIATIEANKKKHISTMSVFHSLLDLGSIQTDYIEWDKSIASPLLQPEKKVWIINSELGLSSISIKEPKVGEK